VVRHFALALVALAGCGRSEAPFPPPAKPPVPQPPSPAPAKKPEEPKAPVDFNLDDVQGDKLSFVEADPGGAKKIEHDLIVFVATAGEFTNRFSQHLKGKGETKWLTSAEDLVLYVLWGDRLGDPTPEAIFDRENRRIVVMAKWTGGAGMDTGTLYRGYGFKLGTLKAGDYGVWVREATPVDKAGPKLTKTFTFTVDP
jgi:hypothetical protein